jgi:hypothetical protein
MERGHAAEAVALGRELMEAIAVYGGAGSRTRQVRLVYAEGLHAVGEREAARAVLAAAHDDLRTVAARIADREVRRRFLSEVPEHARVRMLAAEWLGAR